MLHSPRRKGEVYLRQPISHFLASYILTSVLMSIFFLVDLRPFFHLKYIREITWAIRGSFTQNVFLYSSILVGFILCLCNGQGKVLQAQCGPEGG